MSKLGLTAARAMTVAALLFCASALAVQPLNPSFEADDFVPIFWTIDNASPLVDFTGDAWVVSGEDATDGSNFARTGFYADYAYDAFGYGPLLKSSVFAAGAGEEISLDWRIIVRGGWCTYDLGAGDIGFGRGYLVDAGSDVWVAEFFDTEPACTLPWANASVLAPYSGDFYLLLQVGSWDETHGGVLGAELDVDNVQANAPPDCDDAMADPLMLWPPNHKFHDIEIVGVTDPDGDAFTINVYKIFQDEPTNSDNDGDTCPDASGLGTDTASVLAERVGGEYPYEGDGRYYWIGFTATDVYGAACKGTVKVSVPHDRKTPAWDGGPLFDSTTCP